MKFEPSLSTVTSFSKRAQLYKCLVELGFLVGFLDDFFVNFLTGFILGFLIDCSVVIIFGYFVGSSVGVATVGN